MLGLKHLRRQGLNAVTKSKKAPAPKLPSRIVVKHSDYAQDRAKYHRLVRGRRKLEVQDDDGNVVAVYSSRL